MKLNKLLMASRICEVRKSLFCATLPFLLSTTGAYAQIGGPPSNTNLSGAPSAIGAPGIIPSIGSPGMSAPVEIVTGDPAARIIGTLGCGKTLGAIGGTLGLAAMINDGIAEASCTTAITQCQSGSGWGRDDAMGKIIAALTADIAACPGRAGGARVLIGDAQMIKGQANGFSNNALGWAGAHGTYQIPYFGSVLVLVDSTAQANYDRVRSLCDSISSFNSGLKSLIKQPCGIPTSSAPRPPQSITATLPVMTQDQINNAPGGVHPSESYRIPDRVATGLPIYEGKPYVPAPGSPLRGTCGGGVDNCQPPFSCKTFPNGSGRCDL